MMQVTEKLDIIKQNIEAACSRSGRSADDVKVIAVTKYVSSERAAEAVQAGVRRLGENRDDGLLEKWEHIGDRAEWHFIGTLQTRKVKNIVDKVDYIHSLDRLSLAREISKRTARPMHCFVQVNIAGEESKHGLAPEDTVKFIKQLEDYPNIIVDGLMTMAPHTDDESVLRTCFRGLRILRSQIQDMHLDYAPCTELSMGMSNDYAIAVEEGATFVRIGSALVGSEL